MSVASKDMIAIPIREFISGSVIPVDLFIRLTDEKFILIAKEDSKTQLDQLLSYEHRDIQYLYVRREDYNRYVGKNLVIAGVAVTHLELEQSKKAEFLAKAAASVMKEIEVLGLNSLSLEHARQVSSATKTLIEAKPDLYSVLDSLANLSEDLMLHSVAVAAVSVMTARELGWTKPGTYEKLCLGSFLHDVGLKEVPPEVLKKNRSELTFEDIQAYESHPYRSLEILRSLNSVPDDVVAIAYEHHENSIGQGFPRRLKDMRINPLAKVVALSDQFVDLTLKKTHQPRAKSAHEALHFIEGVMGQPFNRDVFSALKLVIGQQPISLVS